MTAALLDGLVAGLQLGLLALGLSLLHGLAGVLNLAHGSFAVVAAVVAANLADGAGAPIGLAALAGIAAAAALAVALDRTVLRAVDAAPPDARVLLSLLLTLGVAFVVDGLLGWRYPDVALSIRVGGGPVEVLGVPMRRGALVAAGVAAATTVALVALLRGTVRGLAVRSVVQDEVGARLVGVDPARVRTLVLGVGGALAGLVAVTAAMTGPVDVRAGLDLTVQALVVAVVGGLGSVTGALLAGVLLGVVQALAAHLLGSYLTTVVLLLAAAATVLLRPRGLLGGDAS